MSCNASLKNLLLYSGAWFRQNKCIVIMTKEESTKIENFMTPGHGQELFVRALTHKSYSEKVLFL